MENKKLAFIINPASGIRNKDKLRDEIIEKASSNTSDISVVFTAYPGHASELSAGFVSEGYDAVIAAGGDGSVNEVARALLHSNTALGIIPAGSGNGLARHLKIPLNTSQAIECINRYHTRRIDTASLNGLFFCNMAGVGFDGSVAHAFAGRKQRGFFTYLKIVIQEYWNYQPRKYTVKGMASQKDYLALLISFANSSQFGNNASIAPGALIDDGLIDVCIMRKPSIFAVPATGIRMMLGRMRPGRDLVFMRVNSLDVAFQGTLDAHIDGEPITVENQIRIFVQPASLSVITPKEKQE